MKPSMIQLTLQKQHSALGAILVETAGWEIPDHYGDPVHEYQAVRDSVGLIDLSDRGKIVLSGPDRVKFLQGMVTQDVPKIPVGGGVYAASVTVKGKMITDMRVFAASEALILDTEPGFGQVLLDFLGRYAPLSNVKLEDRTEADVLLSLQGPRSKKILERLIGDPLTLNNPLSHEERTVSIGGGEISLRIIRAERGAEDGYDLLLPREHAAALWEALISQGQSEGLRPVGRRVLEILRIERGTPRFGIDMNDDTIPLEAGLEETAISFSKGCYLGQEPIARIHFRGHVNRHLRGILIDGETPPQSGEKVFIDDREIGWITSAAYSPSLRKIVALGYLRREHDQPGEAVAIETNGTRIPAMTAVLPFALPGKTS
jgi:folate-binding protein YgfZ